MKKVKVNLSDKDDKLADSSHFFYECFFKANFLSKCTNGKTNLQNTYLLKMKVRPNVKENFSSNLLGRNTRE